ncbi:MAG: protein translocase subunit SecF [Ruminococcaceae bacterium]|nr:protein translocase subunit SecF [Oscillospiraceae bacterium]
MKFSFVKNRKIFFAISLVMVVATIVCLLTVGLKLDIEFVGGTELTFTLDKALSKEETNKLVAEVEKIIGEKPSVRTAEGNQIILRTTLVDEEYDYDMINASIDKQVKELYPEAKQTAKKNGALTYTIADKTSDLETALSTNEHLFASSVENGEKENEYVVKYTPASEVNNKRKAVEDKVNELYPLAETSNETTRLTNMSTVSSDVSAGLKKTAILATVIAVVLMLVYIAFRFEGRASIAAIICLAHDVIAMVLAYSIFQIPVSSTIIAAILTILGYSINATIVIFDRIRENNKNMSSQVSFEEKVDAGIKSTLLRSLNTTITTLLTIGLIYFMGVTSIKNFALPLIVGIISGVYSSVCLSGNLWFSLKKIGKKN